MTWTTQACRDCGWRARPGLDGRCEKCAARLVDPAEVAAMRAQVESAIRLGQFDAAVRDRAQDLDHDGARELLAQIDQDLDSALSDQPLSPNEPDTPQE